MSCISQNHSNYDKIIKATIKISTKNFTSMRFYFILFEYFLRMPTFGRELSNLTTVSFDRFWCISFVRFVYEHIWELWKSFMIGHFPTWFLASDHLSMKKNWNTCLILWWENLLHPSAFLMKNLQNFLRQNYMIWWNGQWPLSKSFPRLL